LTLIGILEGDKVKLLPTMDLKNQLGMIEGINSSLDMC